MSGRIVAIVILACGLIAGAAVWYLQVYGYYHAVEPAPGRDVRLAARETGEPQPIPYADFQAIDAESSPIRYRACFTTTADPAELAREYETLENRVPRVGPFWFRCFDAGKIDEAIQSGRATLFLGESNVSYGVDRIVAITGDGHGYVWHDLNDCGEKAYDGTELGADCPPLPNAKGGE